MRGKSPSPDALIAAEIAAHGPITFARFMELALYDPEQGYYAANRAKIGRQGDFYTNVSIGPVFGRILAGQFEEMWRRLGSPAPFTIVEQGANDGSLAADVLGALTEEFRAAAEYRIVEPLVHLREVQREKLAAFAHVHWAESSAEAPEFRGVHFSNELIDALPFHLVRSTGAGWEELRVAHDESFQFVPAPPSVETSRLPVRAAGTLAELRPAAETWVREWARKLQAGWLLVIDYGFPRELLLAEHRHEGTFSCYSRHRRDARPLEEPGDKDITAHVDFTTLAEAAQNAGLEIAGFADQHHFMVGASQALLKTLEGRIDPEARKTLRALQSLLHPESMGTQFHYLAFAKNTGPAALSGFQFARDPQKVLW